MSYSEKINALTKRMLNRRSSMGMTKDTGISLGYMRQGDQVGVLFTLVIEGKSAGVVRFTEIGEDEELVGALERATWKCASYAGEILDNPALHTEECHCGSMGGSVMSAFDADAEILNSYLSMISLGEMLGNALAEAAGNEDLPDKLFDNMDFSLN